MQKFIFCLLFFGMNHILMAQDAEYPLDYELSKCLEENGSTQGMLQCIANYEQLWDDQLNIYYKRLITVLDSNAQASLKLTQHNWLTFRDSEKQFIEDYYNTVMNTTGGGTMYQIFLANDQYEIVRKRTIELITYFTYLTEGNVE